MREHEIKDWLKPIYNAVDRLVPTNRSLVDFVNQKASGNGLKRSLYKVKFIEKSEKSTYQCIGLTMSELKKNLAERNVPEDERNQIIEQANNILSEARTQVEKVFGEVRRYIVTSELRTGCVENHFKKIPNMSESQNEAISKEIFSMAMDSINKSDKQSIDDVEEEFNKINKIAITLFTLAEATGGVEHKHKHKAKAKSHESHSSSPFSILNSLWN